MEYSTVELRCERCDVPFTSDDEIVLDSDRLVHIPGLCYKEPASVVCRVESRVRDDILRLENIA